MAYVCRKCAVEMKVERNGVILTPMIVAGTAMEIRRADLWKCPDCGVEIVPVPNNEPELRWLEPAFQNRLDSYNLDPREVVIPYFRSVSEREKAAAVTP
jgi:hypothetical protein